MVINKITRAAAAKFFWTRVFVVLVWIFGIPHAEISAKDHDYQRMGLSSGQSITLTASGTPGSRGELAARCLDKSLPQPMTSDRFTRVLEGQTFVRFSRGGTTREVELSNALADGSIEAIGVAFTEEEFDAVPEAEMARNFKNAIDSISLERYSVPAQQLSPIQQQKLSNYLQTEEGQTRVAQDPAFEPYRRYNSVRFENRMADRATIYVRTATVLGGPHHTPFPFKLGRVIDESSHDQDVLWGQIGEVQAQPRLSEDAKLAIKLSSATENDEKELVSKIWKEAGEENWLESDSGKEVAASIASVQSTLELLGYDVSVTGLPNEETVEALQPIVDDPSRIGLISRAKPRLDELVRDLQLKLNVAGQSCGIDSLIGPETRAAVRDFQDAAGLPVTAVMDEASTARLEAIFDDRKNSFSALAQKDLSDQELIEFIRAQREEYDLPAGVFADGALIGEIEAEVMSVNRNPGELARDIGFVPPGEGNPALWRDFWLGLQRQLATPESGVYDANTRMAMDSLAALREDISDLSESPDDPGVDYLSTDQMSFEVPTGLAVQIEKILTEEFGDIDVRLVPADADPDGKTELTISDNRGYGAAAAIEDLLKTEKIGAGVSAVNGAAVFMSSLPSGATIVQTSNGERTELERVERPKLTGWDRVWKLIGRDIPREKQQEAIQKVVRSSALGSEILVAGGPELDNVPLEQFVSVPVVRPIGRDRATAEVIESVIKASETLFRKSNTALISGLPETAEEHQVLRELSGLQGDYENVWEPAVSDMIGRLPDGVEVGNSRGMVRRLARELANNDNVVIVVAHSDGETLYFPHKNKLQQVSIEELEKYKRKIEKNAPTVLLFACNTGNQDLDVEPFAHGLVNRLGAKMVVAPVDTLTLEEADAFVNSLFNFLDGGQSMVEAFFKIIGDDESQSPLRMFVDLLLQVRTVHEPA